VTSPEIGKKGGQEELPIEPNFTYETFLGNVYANYAFFFKLNLIACYVC
jgi:hypothetical protein